MKSNRGNSEPIQGTIIYQQLEGGLWGLVDQTGMEYQLIDPPQALKKEGLKVVVQGYLQEDIVSIGMWGVPLKIESYVIQE